MPISPTRPTNIVVPFARTGLKNTIPVSTASPLASFDDGFPAVNMMPIVAGGVPPAGKDFNGILFDITTHTLWINAGGQYEFDAALSTAIGGYPVGMVLQSNDGTSAYFNAVANNTTDFNSSPSSIGVSWIPWAGQAMSRISISTIGGTYTLSAIEAAANIIAIVGVLASDLNLVFPVTKSKCFVTNATTGAFNVTAIITGGGGVSIHQGRTDLLLLDGTANAKYAQSDAVTKPQKDNSTHIATTAYCDQAVADVGGFYQDSGVANAYVITTVPVTSSYVDGMSFRFRATNSNTGSSTLNAGPGARSLTREGGAALEANDILPTYVINCTYIAVSNSFVINGVVASDFLDSPALRGTPTAPTPTTGDNSTLIATTAFVQTAQSTATFNLGLYMQGLLM